MKLTMTNLKKNGRATAHLVSKPKPDIDSVNVGKELADLRGRLQAINLSQAVIQFEMDGTIIDANENFLKVMGYTREEIVGRNHNIFVEPGYCKSAEYAQFWRDLQAGKFQAGEFKRIGKGGMGIWIQGAYNPVLDLDGKPCKVVKVATDVTARKLKDADCQGQMAAISKAQAVIEFNLDGTIITANEGFLKAVGYTLDEIKGRHHDMFLDEAYPFSVSAQGAWLARQA